MAVFSGKPGNGLKAIWSKTLKEDGFSKRKALRTLLLIAALCLIAAGFLGCQSYIAEAFGTELDGRTNVRTDAGCHATSVDKVFTAGDMHIGQSLVVRAIREGRDAAAEVDEYLMGYTQLR